MFSFYNGCCCWPCCLWIASGGAVVHCPYARLPLEACWKPPFWRVETWPQRPKTSQSTPSSAGESTYLFLPLVLSTTKHFPPFFENVVVATPPPPLKKKTLRKNHETFSFVCVCVCVQFQFFVFPFLLVDQLMDSSCRLVFHFAQWNYFETRFPYLRKDPWIIYILIFEPNRVVLVAFCFFRGLGDTRSRQREIFFNPLPLQSQVSYCCLGCKHFHSTIFAFHPPPPFF